MARTPKPPSDIENYRHAEAKRKMIPTAEQQGLVASDEAKPVRLAYPRDTSLDPQLVWRGKDQEDQSDLYVDAPPVYIQEKIHPRVIIERLKKDTAARAAADAEQIDLFSDFNGRPEELEARTEFYAHEQNWQNRLVLGDALMVMASLAEREGLRGKVQCVYMDPPYGIKFNSNWQTHTNNRDVKDGSAAHVSREPEVIKAFRDTWKDGVNTYLSYLRDRLVLARDLLAQSGSIFVQIGDENMHLVRSLLDEVFGAENFVSQISVKKTAAQTDYALPSVVDYIIWYARDKSAIKYRPYYLPKEVGDPGSEQYRSIRTEDGSLERIADPKRFTPAHLCRPDNLTSSHEYSRGKEPYQYRGITYDPGRRYWSTSPESILRLERSSRLHGSGRTLSYTRFLGDFPVFPLLNVWTDTGTGGYGDERYYVVQTTAKIVQRCLLMVTDPGDLVLDPTCGSGTTAYVAEQWGRRWITIDTSRVALTLARQRLMAARFPYYLLQDSPEGWEKENEKRPTGQRRARPARFSSEMAQGFVYERAPHITMKSIANNADIDAVWDHWQRTLEPLRESLNVARKTTWEEWEIPRLTIWDKKKGESIANPVLKAWPEADLALLSKWWDARRARQKDIDTSIEKNADVELLYDRPFEDKKTVRVAGPFTVESLSPYRVIPSVEDPALLAALASDDGELPRRTMLAEQTDFAQVVVEHLKAAGVQNTKKGEAIKFESLTPKGGEGYVSYEGRYTDAKGISRRVAVAIGPEYDSVGYDFIFAARREALRSTYDMLLVCGFQFAPDTDASRFDTKELVVLHARMNQDIRMGERLKNTGAGNLFVVFGEPDIDVREAGDGMIEVEIKGVDIFDPTTGEVKSSGDPADDIACWFIDDAYDEESFFVRHAYFLGGASGDPYAALKRALKADIDEDAWAGLHSTVSRPFPKPESGHICVKVINHFGDEVQKVFAV
tara:strand:- start:2393 stop:5251 length:2859 start_codon:yes stop_codon:yes gene_type:complete